MVCLLRLHFSFINSVFPYLMKLVATAVIDPRLRFQQRFQHSAPKSRRVNQIELRQAHQHLIAKNANTSAPRCCCREASDNLIRASKKTNKTIRNICACAPAVEPTCRHLRPTRVSARLIRTTTPPKTTRFRSPWRPTATPRNRAVALSLISLPFHPPKSLAPPREPAPPEHVSP